LWTSKIVCFDPFAVVWRRDLDSFVVASGPNELKLHTKKVGRENHKCSLHILGLNYPCFTPKKEIKKG
jgi:hypothetical protein